MGCFNIPGDAVLSPDGRTLLLTGGDETAAERTAQRLRVGLRTVLGTYKYDLARGVPWFRWLDKPNRAELRTGIRDFFLRQPEVRSILALDFLVDRTTRLLTVRYQLQMISGDVVTHAVPITPLP